jgi:hypothetical protein
VPRVVSRGPAGPTYFLQHGVTREVLHNPATRGSLTSVATITDKDLRVTDNGDGTSTILILATGNAVLCGPDGKAIARDPGQTRFKVLVDDGGTPNDPSDDEFVSDLGTVTLRARPTHMVKQGRRRAAARRALICCRSDGRLQG